MCQRSGTGWATDWIDLPHVRDRWRAVVNGVIKLRVSQNAGNWRLAEDLFASQEGLCSMDLLLLLLLLLIVVWS